MLLGHQTSATNLRRAKDGFFLINTDFTYDPASDITAITDNVRPERTQAFGYDALSRLTSADGAYGSIQYGYNAGGDRTSRDWSKTDGTLLSEDYTYEAATARLLGVSLDDGAGNMTPIRDFTYNASGQVVSDNRSGNIYDYGMNARGRMTTVTLGGVEIAAYTYDESEQRIIKVAPGSGSGASAKTTHYHYDLEGRLIAETDGTTGETLREYVWLGLMPIAVIAPDPGSGSGTGGECNPALIEALEAELTASTAAATALQTQILDRDGNIAFREAKIAEMRAQLDGLSGKKREQLEAKIAKWESLITSTTAKVTEAEAELAAINATIADIQTSLAEQQAICEGTVTGTEAGTFYLHADHLGRPQFATDSDGAIVWDMGEGVTPFGQGVNLAGAFAQKLMFPGQYADAETSEEIILSHNWHRTYDPTLGRYLQSDPIGLAGGLNRYAYVGGNPVGYVDPDGLETYWGIPGKDFNDYSFLERYAFVHYNRNVFNQAPCYLSQAKDLEFTQEKKDFFHNMGLGAQGNTKWTKDNFEGVYGPDGVRRDDALNGGTYNYGKGIVEHTVLDVLPYYWLGNNPNDPTSAVQRILRTAKLPVYNGLVPASDSCACTEPRPIELRGMYK